MPKRAGAEQVGVRGIVVDLQGNIVLGNGGWAQRLRPNGTEISRVEPPVGKGGMHGYLDLAFDEKATLYAMGPGLVARIGPDGNILHIWSAPRPLAVDRMGFVYASDMTGGITKYQPDGKIEAKLEAWSTGKPKFASAIAVDSRNDVLAWDKDGGRLYRVARDGKPVSDWNARAAGMTAECWVIAIAKDGTVFLGTDDGRILKVKL